MNRSRPPDALRRRLLAASALVAAVPGAAAQAREPRASGGPGRFVELPWQGYGVSARERSWLRGVRDAIGRQVRGIPVLERPAGFDVVLYTESNGELLLGPRRARPIRGRFAWACYAPVFKTIYDPVTASVVALVNRHFRELVLIEDRTLPDQYAIVRPTLQPIAAAGGLPGWVKRDARQQEAHIVITPDGRLPWRAATVEEYLRARMRLDAAGAVTPQQRAMAVDPLERELAGFSASERASPAYMTRVDPSDFRTGVSANAGAPGAMPLTLVDVEFYDAARPRESIQLLEISVHCPGDRAAGAQMEPGSARETLSTLLDAALSSVDWAGLRALVQRDGK